MLKLDFIDQEDLSVPITPNARFPPPRNSWQNQGVMKGYVVRKYSENQEFAPENRPIQKETSLSTVIFQVLC